MISRCACSETSASWKTFFDWSQWHRLERRFTALSIRPPGRSREMLSKPINKMWLSYSRREFTLARHHKYQVELRKSHMCMHTTRKNFSSFIGTENFSIWKQQNRKTGKKSARDHYICESNSVLQPNKPLRHKSALDDDEKKAFFDRWIGQSYSM